MKNIIYLLCGLPGSGKTTYAKSLESRATIRLSLDEEVFKRYGRDFDSSKYQEYEEQTEQDLSNIIKSSIYSGHDVILDYGFWRKQKRDKYKQIATDFGSVWKLIYFNCPLNILKKRLISRNKTIKDDSQVVTVQMLSNFIKNFEAPIREGEETKDNT